MAGVIAALSYPLSLFLGKFNSVNGHLRYHLCPEAATALLPLSLPLPPSSLPPVYIALVTPPSYFALTCRKEETDRGRKEEIVPFHYRVYKRHLKGGEHYKIV